MAAQPSALGARSSGCHHVAGDAIDRLEALQLVLRAGPHQTADEKSPRKKCASDALADEAGAAGEEYALRHDANRSTGLREFRAAGRW